MPETYNQVIGYKNTNKAVASPAAQTFLAPRGGYLSEIDLYFTSLQPDKNNVGKPVTLQIRNCDSTGEPGSSVYGETTRTFTELKQDTNQYGKARFIFTDPVFVEAGKSYAFLIYTSAMNYQLAVSSNGKIQYQNNSNPSLTPNGKVHGSFYYSEDGTDWVKGDPTDSLQANAGGLCLKFDIQQAQFSTFNQYHFEVNPVNYEYNDINPQTPQYNHQHQDGISYMTFSPNEFTPYNTSVDWLYSDDNGKTYHNLPLNTTIPVNVEGDDIRVVARVNGSPAFTPLINKGSLHFATQRTICDADNRNSSDGQSIDPSLSNFEFPVSQTGLSDTKNSGEYISKVITFGDTPHSQKSVFNQINASFEELNSGKRPTSLYINLNPNNQPAEENSWKNLWIQLNGYDEYHQNGTDLMTALNSNGGQFNEKVAKAMQPNQSYIMANPRTGVSYNLDKNGYPTSQVNPSGYTQHTYSENTENTYDGSWTKYHFHLSLKRLWNVAKGNYHQSQANNDVAHEIQFKIVFHAESPYDHPKVRRFLTTVGKDDEKEQQLSVN